MTKCECEKAGFCFRHGIKKGRAWHRLCQTKEHYFQAWEKGKGPGQRKPDLTIVKHTVVIRGVGSILQSILGCKRFVHVKEMNDWGIDNCILNMDTIIQWLMEYGAFSESHAKRIFSMAISRCKNS
jgi:hypothetical protein